MGIYLNPGNTAFQRALNSEIYIDKSGLLRYTNNKLFTEQQFICVSRPRRFGKSIAANMLTAYYSRGCDSRELFAGLDMERDGDFEKHLNEYNVIHLNMADFLSESAGLEDMLRLIEEDILDELSEEFEQVRLPKRRNLVRMLNAVFEQTGIPFVFIIDEWDCIFRVNKYNDDGQTRYLDFLRNILKDKNYVALAYMTGILPIKKYGEHSALNMFTEVSMTDPREFAEFTGFTEREVRALCEAYHMSFEEARLWYDGYQLRGISVYNPRSVVMAMTGGYFSNYWTSTETYEALKIYVEMNFDGLRDKIIQLIAGGEVSVNTAKFQNDMTTFRSADDILTLLIHLGYLTFDFDKKTARIPNSEVQQEFINSIEDGGWESVMRSIHVSEELLDATLRGDETRVAELLEQSHDDNTSILKYNDENSLSCVISLAYYTAKKNYAVYREMPAGKGFADLVFIPRKRTDVPAMIIELKYDRSVETAIRQIKEKRYADCLQDYSGEILLVGVEYDKDSETKKHICRIEKITKNAVQRADLTRIM